MDTVFWRMLQFSPTLASVAAMRCANTTQRRQRLLILAMVEDVRQLWDEADRLHRAGKEEVASCTRALSDIVLSAGV